MQTGYAGFQDWRPPTIGELKSIIDTSVAGCGGGVPYIDPIFAPTAASFYWSSTSIATNPDDAWLVNFGGGNVFVDNKGSVIRVRAVRGCLGD